tara:strand:+ start:521 stop:1348 length:828 start_codon:yes stop_codon:yes gene_type:complete
VNLILRFLAIILFSTNSFADGISQYISNLIPGEGDTEVSIDLRENHKPDYSILAVREIEKTETGNIFTQLSLFNTEKNNDERIVGNIGFGLRSLSEDKTILTGFNSFIDYDDNDNARMSIGVEGRSAVLEFWFNQYFGISDGKDEKVLDGYDLRLASQIPYLHWGDVFINAYEWEGRDRDDIKGKKLGSELLLTPNINLEIAYDDKDKIGLEDEWYTKIIYFHPPRSGPSLQDGFVNDDVWKEEKDMSGELLTKVQRNNKIMVEFKGLSTISRTD